MFRADYARFRALRDYDDSVAMREDVEERIACFAGDRSCGRGECMCDSLDPELVEKIKAEMLPALLAAQARVEEVYDHIGADTGEMDGALNDLEDICDLTELAVYSAYPSEDADFDISTL